MAIIRVFLFLLVDTPALRIIRYGINDVMPPKVSDCVHGMEGYTFMFFPSEAYIRVGEEFRRYSPGHVVIWPPFARMHYGHPEQAWNHHWICCDGRFIEEQMGDGVLPLGEPFPLHDTQLAPRYLHAIELEMSQGAPDPLIAQNCLHNMLLELKRQKYGRENELTTPERWLVIKRHLEDTYNQQHTLAELARMAHLSTSHFCAEFKRLFGMSAIEYLIDLRMHHALLLLHNGNLSITEVATQVGYPDLFHFSKTFKSRFACSPRAMRRQMLASMRGE